jgi:hypothetical protein
MEAYSPELLDKKMLLGDHKDAIVLDTKAMKALEKKIKKALPKTGNGGHFFGCKPVGLEELNDRIWEILQATDEDWQ